jgi:hypothetical protein
MRNDDKMRSFFHLGYSIFLPQSIRGSGGALGDIEASRIKHKRGISRVLPAALHTESKFIVSYGVG